MTHLSCPLCHKPLTLEGRSWQCENHHNYDIARQGYVNLLLNPDKASNNPGDSRESLDARRAFLTKGWYRPILDDVLEAIRTYAPGAKDILDLGCGEGWYTAEAFKQMPECTFYGLDISKLGVRMATRYTKDIVWMVGNSKNLPIEDHSLDAIMALFTVVNSDEIARTLKQDGIMVHVTANRNHLIEIKHLIYDEVFVKSDEHIRQPFDVLESHDLTKTIHIDNREDALNLLKMTPHYYHIRQDKRPVLDELQALDVTIDVKVTVYRP